MESQLNENKVLQSYKNMHYIEKSRFTGRHSTSLVQSVSSSRTSKVNEKINSSGM